MLTLEATLAAAATLVAFAFALSTYERYLARRRRHELAWTISLIMFTIAAGALWWGSAAGWSGPSFRTFFLFGAVLNVPWLALGTVYLLGGIRLGDRIALVLAVLSGFAAGVLVVAPLTGPIEPDGLPKGSDVFGVLPRLLAGVASGVGALVVIGGALWSAGRLAAGKARSGSAGTVASPRRLVAGNLLIALGTLVLSASGTLNARLGAMSAFSITLLVGVAVLFAGFVVATSAGSGRRLELASDRAAAA